MANFDSLVFPGLQVTQKIHAQNSRPELSAFLSNFTFVNPKFTHGDFLLTGETKIYRSWPDLIHSVLKGAGFQNYTSWFPWFSWFPL